MKGTAPTAITQEISSASVTTAKMVNVYSPVDERAVAMGRKPTAVISVPVSIGKAVLV